MEVVDEGRGGERGSGRGASLFNLTSVGKYGRQIKDSRAKILQRGSLAREVGPKLYNNRVLVGSLTPTRGWKFSFNISFVPG